MSQMMIATAIAASVLTARVQVKRRKAAKMMMKVARL
jgi:hypothetical protein